MNAAHVPTSDDIAASRDVTGPVTVRPDLMHRLGVAARVARFGLQLEVASAGVILTTDRLTLRPLQSDDRAEFLRMMTISRGHLGEFCPLGTPAQATDDAIFDRQLALSDGAVRTGKACRLVAFDNDARMVGGFNINDIQRGLEHSGEIVFWLSADSLRRGYAEESVRALLEHAMADMPRGLGLHRVHCYIAPENQACRRLVNKLGMRMRMDTAPKELVIGTRRICHDQYEAFAHIPVPTEAPGMTPVVEGKPSIAEELFGRGLLSILRTERVVLPEQRSDGDVK